MNKRHIVLIFCWVIVWKVLLLIVGSVATQVIEYKPSFSGYQELDSTLGNRSISAWANFDGFHYLTIATKGYLGTALIQAFFPVYPILLFMSIELIQLFLPNVASLNIGIISGQGISLFFFFLSVLVWQKYMQERFSEQIIQDSTLLLFLFPTSFFFSAIYNESLFLFLLLCTFYAADKKRYGIAVLCAICLTATRIVGIFIIPALVIELYVQWSNTPKHFTLNKIVLFLKQKWKTVSLISLSGLGLISYMWYLYLEFQDPVYFFSVQSEFGAGREEKIILLPQVFFRYLKILLTARPFDFKYFAAAQEVFISLAVLLILLSVLFFKKLKFKTSEVVFALMAFVLPTLTGTFSSMPRYVLICFPIFYLIPQLLQLRWMKLSFMVLSVLLLLFNTFLFIQGYFVA